MSLISGSVPHSVTSGDDDGAYIQDCKAGVTVKEIGLVGTGRRE